MQIEKDGLSFVFSGANAISVFDDHGMPMKAVDLLAEFDLADVYVEIKDFHDPARYDASLHQEEEEMQAARDSFKWLKNYLKYKYRDSYLFRHARNKVEKPIHYICLLNFDDAHNAAMQRDLHRELPVGIPRASGWERDIARSCHVVNLPTWRQRFPEWTVSKLP